MSCSSDATCDPTKCSRVTDADFTVPLTYTFGAASPTAVTYMTTWASPCQTSFRIDFSVTDDPNGLVTFTHVLNADYTKTLIITVSDGGDPSLAHSNTNIMASLSWNYITNHFGKGDFFTQEVHYTNICETTVFTVQSSSSLSILHVAGVSTPVESWAQNMVYDSVSTAQGTDGYTFCHLARFYEVLT